ARGRQARGWAPSRWPDSLSAAAAGARELESSGNASHTGGGGPARSAAVWYRVGAARAASREGGGRARVFDKSAMRRKLFGHALIAAAGLISAASACRKEPAQAAVAVQKASPVGGPSASVAKPLDATSEARPAAGRQRRRLGSRDDLELSLQYVKRALPRAQKGRDRGLLKELHLLEAMALDDLGRPGEALAAASKALEYEPKDREARREKGV